MSILDAQGKTVGSKVDEAFALAVNSQRLLAKLFQDIQQLYAIADYMALRVEKLTEKLGVSMAEVDEAAKEALEALKKEAANESNS